jgi:hypothetical protein
VRGLHGPQAEAGEARMRDLVKRIHPDHQEGEEILRIAVELIHQSPENIEDRMRGAVEQINSRKPPGHTQTSWTSIQLHYPCCKIRAVDDSRDVSVQETGDEEHSGHHIHVFFWDLELHRRLQDMQGCQKFC